MTFWNINKKSHGYWQMQLLAQNLKVKLNFFFWSKTLSFWRNLEQIPIPTCTETESFMENTHRALVFRPPWRISLQRISPRRPSLTNSRYTPTTPWFACGFATHTLSSPKKRCSITSVHSNSTRFPKRSSPRPKNRRGKRWPIRTRVASTQYRRRSD